MNPSCHLLESGEETEFFGRIYDRKCILFSKRAMLAMESVEKLGL